MSRSNYFTGLIQWFIRLPPAVPERLHRTYYVSLAGGVSGLFIHLVWILIFYYTSIMNLFYINIVSILIWSLVIPISRKGYVLLAFTLGVAEVIFHAFFAVYYLGWDYGFQYYLILGALFAFFYEGKIFIPLTIASLSASFFILFYLFVQHMNPYPVDAGAVLRHFFYISNIFNSFLVSSAGVFTYRIAVQKAEKTAEEERKKSEELLLNILPGSIVHRLKEDRSVIADHFEEGTILFADLAGFTKWSEKISPSELVTVLNSIFSKFDAAVSRRGLEKIKTIGDAYMAAGGFPSLKGDHVLAVTELAGEMMEILKTLNKENNTDFHIRIGIHTGPVVAGVIGTSKFLYDVWGDTVNTASRLESHGLPDQIHISLPVFEAVSGEYEAEARGLIEIKGKEPMHTYFLRKKKYHSQ